MPKRSTEESTARALCKQMRKDAQRLARATWAPWIKDHPEEDIRWGEKERTERAHKMEWLHELEGYYEALPPSPSTDLRRDQILSEILLARQRFGDISRRVHRRFRYKWVAQCEKVRRFHELITLEWKSHTARGLVTLAGSRKAHPDTDEKYRAYVKQIYDMRNAKRPLGVTSAIKALARDGNNHRIPESTSWRAWRRFGAPAK